MSANHELHSALLRIRCDADAYIFEFKNALDRYERYADIVRPMRADEMNQRPRSFIDGEVGTPVFLEMHQVMGARNYRDGARV
jgi:hypothetical protein